MGACWWIVCVSVDVLMVQVKGEWQEEEVKERLAYYYRYTSKTNVK